MKWSNIIDEIKIKSIEATKSYLNSERSGSYLLIDVRQPGEYAKGHIPGAVLMPLNDLIAGQIDLPEHQPLLIYSRTDRRSQAAARWFVAEGFKEVYRVENGLDGWNGNKALGHFELNLNLIKEDIEFPDALSMAYAMEEGLRQFYLEIARETTDDFYKKLYRKLASFEVEHKQAIAESYAVDNGKKLIEKEFAQQEGQILEGGSVTDETLIKTLANTSSVYDVFSLAIAFETQAFDFYVRLSRHAVKPEAKAFFLEMAEAEKAHLAFVTNEMNNYLRVDS